MEALTHCPPWLQQNACSLLSLANANRLHHALLLTGVEGIGKHEFAQWLVEALLCRQVKENGACGQCEACSQLLADAHPELRTLAPEGASFTIKIDAVRELVDWLQLTAGANSYRIALINHADTLNHHAANSLLKTLEEPADNAILVLCATRAGRLPATVRSRCRKVMLTMNDAATAIDWLSSKGIAEPEQSLIDAGGAPLLALRYAHADHLQNQQLLIKAWSDLFMHKASVAKISDSLADLDTSVCLAAFSRWCVIAAKQSAGATAGTMPVVQETVAIARNHLSSEQWFKLHDRLLQLHRSDSASFKTKTVLEGLFADIRIMINR